MVNLSSRPALVVPPLTPFDAALKVDRNALRSHIDYVVDACRATMIVAAGVETQEYHYLPLAERKELVRATIEAVDGRVPVVVGISHPSVNTAIELGQFASALGAHAIQLLAPLRPFGGAPTTDEVVCYFDLIAAETDLPIMLYLNPGPGADLSVDATLEVAKLDRVKYVKESSRDLTRVSRLIAQIDRAGHAQYLTTVQMLLITLQLGGSGATMPPPLAELGAKIIAAFEQGNVQEAARLQQQFSLFPARWMHRGLMPTMKAALKALGRGIGEPYPPFGNFTADEAAQLATYLQTTDLSHVS
ncbi:dihydrodipicolinate synthase family protein [Burkholderia multivorans]|uniref:dihydrodipicolinate synthase family protein n=1 Tax=Burkholderia multivorans TaxID=87883 RepID=UPI0008422569|nr:dihydrodipicolinate synthase family protein [Burkholderia multivorans]AOJ94795.1 dihydrodipicolinate synthase family protein [Burkholderia multivorans]MBU9598184.1 dihydrodipicolinate synthase family protein [Burkholderia multivorans]MDN7873402.1 dihydrodipicolinate synthase family protein [Burkholderia multivorans]